MIKLKSADRIKIMTLLGAIEVKGEFYRGFGINRDYLGTDQYWRLTCIFNGWAIAKCRKKNDCRLLADEIIKKINKTDIVDRSDFDLIKDIVKKYMAKEE